MPIELTMICQLRLLANQLFRQGKADIARTSRKCLLLTQSGHLGVNSFIYR